MAFSLKPQKQEPKSAANGKHLTGTPTGEEFILTPMLRLEREGSEDQQRGNRVGPCACASPARWVNLPRRPDLSRYLPRLPPRLPRLLSEAHFIPFREEGGPGFRFCFPP